MTEAFIFIVTTLIAYVALMTLPKREGKENGVVWLITNIMMLIGCWVFLTGVANLFTIKINLYTLAIINVLIVTIIALYMFLRKKQVQRYFFKWQDILVVVLLAVIAVAIGIYRFDGLEVFAYKSDDSVRHLSYTLDIIKTGNFTVSRYAMYLVDFVFIKCIIPFAGEMYSYKAFVAADIFLLFMLGAMFRSWITAFVKGKYGMITGALFAIMYFLGYPLNNMLYGFEYLGMGVLATNYLLWIACENEKSELNKGQFVIMLMAANSMIFLSYTQFAPAVVFGEAIYFILYFIGKKKLISLNALVTVVLGVGIPGFLCMTFVVQSVLKKIFPAIVLGVFVVLLLAVIFSTILKVRGKNSERSVLEVWRADISWLSVHKKFFYILLGIIAIIAGVLAYKYIYVEIVLKYVVSGGLSADGNIYREPYANFIILGLLLILYIIDCGKKKRNDLTLWIMAGSVLFSVWLVRCILTGTVGTYYFYKMHYLIWMLLFGMAFRMLMLTKDETRYMLSVYLGAAMVYFCSMAIGWEKKLENSNAFLWTDSISTKVFGIYNYNMELLAEGGNLDKDAQVVLNIIYGLVKDENTFVPYFGEEAQHKKDYYYYLTGQNPKQHMQKVNDPENPVKNILARLRKRGAKYIFVENEYEGAYAETFAKWHHMFETEYGSIVAVPEKE